MKKKITNNLLLLALFLISINFSYGQCINEDFVAFADWTNVGTATDNDPLHYGAAAPCRAIAIADSLISPLVDNPNLLEFYQDASGGGDGMNATVDYRIGGVAGTWATLYTFAVSTLGVNESLDLTNIVGVPDLSTQTGVEFRFNSTFNTWYLDDVKVTCRTKVGFVSTVSSVTEGTVSIDVCVSIINPDPIIATQVEIALDPSSTAINGTDYNNGVMTTPIVFPHIITFPAGSSVDQCLTININDDSIVEPDETIVLFLQNASGGNVAQIAPNAASPFHTVTILDKCPGGITTWELTFPGGVPTFAWSNGVPDGTMHAIIDFPYYTQLGNPLGGQSIDACVLEIKSGGLVVTNGQYVRVANDIINEFSLAVQNGGSVVQVNDNATVSGVIGTFSVQIQTTALPDPRYTYFSSPVQNETLNIFNSWGQMNRIYSFDGSVQDWASSSATDLMLPGVGYVVRPAGNTSTVFSPAITPVTTFNGAFNNGIFTQPMYFNVPGAPDPTDDDSALVGNPYPSAIDSNLLFQANAQLGGIQIWTHNSGSGSNYGAWANNDYIVCAAGNNCTAADPLNTISHNGIIASGQGFFATANVASPADLTFNNSMRVTTGNDQFRNPNTDRMWIGLSSPNGYYSQTLFVFTENGSVNLNNQYDALRLGNGYGLAFYSLTADTNDRLAIEDRGILTDSMNIPVGYYLNNPDVTELTFSIANFENLENVDVYLKDNLLNTLYDLKISDYTFNTTGVGVYDGRFEITFTRDVLSADNEIITNDTLVVSNANETQINVNMLDGSIVTSIKAFDILGKLILDMKPNANDFVINTNVKQGQVLFFKATLENGQVLSNKFMKL